jgi:hypothetical protein
LSQGCAPLRRWFRRPRFERGRKLL